MNTATHTIPKPAQRIQCVRMGSDPDPIPSGSRGTVLHVEQWGAGPKSCNIHVAWDSGRTLALLSDVDCWKILTAEKM